MKKLKFFPFIKIRIEEIVIRTVSYDGNLGVGGGGGRRAGQTGIENEMIGETENRERDGQTDRQRGRKENS